MRPNEFDELVTKERVRIQSCHRMIDFYEEELREITRRMLSTRVEMDDARFTQHVVKTVTVDADTYEEAAAKAREAKPEVVAKDMQPEWISTKKHLNDQEEFEYPIIGPCALCGVEQIDRPVKGQPWTYGVHPDNDHGGLCCYKCITARKGER